MWLKELKTHANPDIKIFLIGNKIDLVDSRKVTAEEAKKLKDDFMMNLYMETSAKTGFNAKEIFIQAAKVLYKEHLRLITKGILEHVPWLIQASAQGCIYHRRFT